MAHYTHHHHHHHQSSAGEPLESQFVSTLPDNVMQNHHQIRDGEITDSISSISEAERGDAAQPCRPRLECGSSRPTSTTPHSNYQIFNDVQLIRHRHVRADCHVRKQFQILCEDKASRYKLDEVHFSLPSSLKSTFIMTFSPDGQRVASTHGDHRIYICDLNTGRLLDTLEGHPKTPWCLAWHPSNSGILASGCLAGEVRVWDLKSKACESWTSEDHTIITSLDFHPMERVLVIATSNEVLFWDWSESEPFAKTSTMHDREKVKYVLFDSSGTKLITGISNLPRFSGYSSDSLQNRIIDGYLSQGSNNEPLQTDDMTQNSEITRGPINNSQNRNENLAREMNPDNEVLNGHSRNTAQPVGYGTTSACPPPVDETSYRNTLLLSRVASLYRQLESLEDSIRHTSFTPFLNYQQQEGASASSEGDQMKNGGSLPDAQTRIQECQTNLSGNDGGLLQEQQQQQLPPPQPSASGNSTGSNPNASGHPSPLSSSSSSSMPTANSFEPYLVSFDETLEQLRLPPLIVDGNAVNPATVLQQYPIDMSRQLYHAMQFDSINQCSQNFIRISKLMSSARLYRQIVQQIATSNSGDGILQPNQLLTAQSVTPRSPRNSPNLPVVLRNLDVASSPLDSGSNHQPNTDPILAIEFRNSARNVPLPTICKIDLLAARAICILRSQTLVEQALANVRPPKPPLSKTFINGNTARSSETSTKLSEVPAVSIQPIISQLHSTLTTISHAPLTTSNAYTHITSLRVLIEKLHKQFSSMLASTLEGTRICDLIHKIANSLTGRSWSVPLGATLDEIRLDVIHILCIVDLSLHFTRQIQLLQMQRISLVTRVDESTKPSVKLRAEQSLTGKPDEQSTSSVDEPCTSKAFYNKRKSPTSSNANKRRRIMMRPINVAPKHQLGQHRLDVPPRTAPANHDQSSPPDRLAVWQQSQQQIEQSLQRFFVATSSSVHSSHILVRFYRLPGAPSSHPFQANPSDSLTEHRYTAQTESRRRASSQDYLMNAQESIDTAGSAEMPPARIRGATRPPAPGQLNIVPSSSGHNNNNNNNNSSTNDAWQRHPHLHVYQTRGSGPHLWFNQWTIPLPMNSSNYRLQCWNYATGNIPMINNPAVNIITPKCRIHNDSSIDISGDGSRLACLVPKDDASTCFPTYDLKIFSLRADDFGACYYKFSSNQTAVSVSLSPSSNYAIIGYMNHKFMTYDQAEENLIVAKVFKLAQNNTCELVRDIKVKRDDATYNLNAIKWMHRGIVYNVGPQHHHRYQTARVRNVVAS